MKLAAESLGFSSKRHQDWFDDHRHGILSLLHEKKTVYGPTQHVVHLVKSKNGTKVIKDHEGILSRWAEHLKKLLNCVNPTDPTLVDLIPQLPIIPQLDLLPFMKLKWL